MKSLKGLKNTFKTYRKLGIDMTEAFSFRYLFFSEEKDSLEKVSESLSQIGFKTEPITKRDDDKYWLRVSKKEIHDADSFYQLNLQLKKIASENPPAFYHGYHFDESKYMALDKFEYGNSLVNEYPKLLRINVGIKDKINQKKFPYLVALKIIPVENNNSKEYLESVYLTGIGSFESNINTELREQGVPSYFLGLTTYKQIRNSFFMVKDKVKAASTLELLKKQPGEISFEFSIVEDIKWDKYGELIKELDATIHR